MPQQRRINLEDERGAERDDEIGAAREHMQRRARQRVGTRDVGRDRQPARRVGASIFPLTVRHRVATFSFQPITD